MYAKPQIIRQSQSQSPRARTIAVAIAAGINMVIDSAPRNLSMNGSERRSGYCMANGTGIGVADFAVDLEAIV